MDTLLSSYLKKTLDSRIPGFFAAGVKRGYSLSDELKSRESILQLFEAQNAYGMLRHVCVDIAIQNEAKRLGLGITVEQKRVSKNGIHILYYLMITQFLLCIRHAQKKQCQRVLGIEKIEVFSIEKFHYLMILISLIQKKKAFHI